MEETRVDSNVANKIIDKTNLSDKIFVEVVGFSSGIWVLWDASKIKLEAISLDEQIINLIATMDGGKSFFMSAVYASATPVFRQDLWEYIICLGVVVKVSWLLLGDFNQILSQEEKRDGSSAIPGRMEEFREVLRNCELVDLKFSSPPLTWTNMQKGLTNIHERLDRVLGNRRWLSLYPDCKVCHLSRSRSDHCPLLVQMGDSDPLMRKQTAPKILAAWFLHPQFEEFVELCWSDSRQQGLVSKLHHLQNSLQHWNKRIFGNIFYRKFRCLAQLGGIQKTLHERISEWLEDLEHKFQGELDIILQQEDAFWRQKSRITWLKEGEQNTRFFHLSTVI